MTKGLENFEIVKETIIDYFFIQNWSLSKYNKIPKFKILKVTKIHINTYLEMVKILNLFKNLLTNN